MLKIQVEAHELQAIHHGDVRVLKTVLERESDKMREALVQQASPDTFRFQQGQAQAIDAVMKLLP